LVIRKDLIAPASERLAHQLFAAAIVIFPGVVHKRDALINGLLHQPDGLAIIFNLTDMIAAEADGGNLHASATQRAQRNFRRVLIAHLLLSPMIEIQPLRFFVRLRISLPAGQTESDLRRDGRASYTSRRSDSQTSSNGISEKQIAKRGDQNLAPGEGVVANRW
jgi:hypothetical protein